MISGIILEFTADELRRHLEERATYHLERARQYEERVDSLKEMGREEQEGVSNDPVRSLEHSRKEHQEKGAFFTIVAEHLIPGETYRLSFGDLRSLEFTSKYF